MSVKCYECAGVPRAACFSDRLQEDLKKHHVRVASERMQDECEEDETDMCLFDVARQVTSTKLAWFAILLSEAASCHLGWKCSCLHVLTVAS